LLALLASGCILADGWGWPDVAPSGPTYQRPRADTGGEGVGRVRRLISACPTQLDLADLRPDPHTGDTWAPTSHLLYLFSSPSWISCDPPSACRDLTLPIHSFFFPLKFLSIYKRRPNFFLEKTNLLTVACSRFPKSLSNCRPKNISQILYHN
jgi:hypothetical protein